MDLDFHVHVQTKGFCRGDSDLASEISLHENQSHIKYLSCAPHSWLRQIFHPKYSMFDLL